MKFKDLISDLSFDKKLQFKAWRKRQVTYCILGFIICDLCGLGAGYLEWGLPDPTVNLDSKQYTCQDLIDGIKGVGQRMTETGTLPPAHLLESLESLESKLKC